jgi:hypothetical protein
MVLILFLSNILLYSHNEDYRDALIEMVTGKNEDDIPVVDVSRDVIISYDEDNVTYRDLNYNVLTEDEVPLSAAYIDDQNVSNESTTEYAVEETTVDESVEDDCGDEPVIVDKEYHEDCGTGKGYWIIKYEDGSTVIEQ